MLVTHASDYHGAEQLRRKRIDHTTLDDLAGNGVDEVPELVGVVGVLALEGLFCGKCEHVALDSLGHHLLEDVGVELSGYGSTVCGHVLSGCSSLASVVCEVCVFLVALLLKGVGVGMIIGAVEQSVGSKIWRRDYVPRMTSVILKKLNELHLRIFISLLQGGNDQKIFKRFHELGRCRILEDLTDKLCAHSQNLRDMIESDLHPYRRLLPE